ncbi:MAG: hypothetical protein EG822_15205 [Deltaproteobacteria bacterium]|nr:hypothetical protein [Deltaproteobacteria bacterium]TLN03981.1 MAG: hypothetical protein FDZ73_05585 [bacterium]
MEVLDIISKCEISNRFRLILLSVVVILISFHTFVLTAPLTCPSLEKLDYYRQVSNSLSNLSVALILMFIIIQLQADIHFTFHTKRTRSYQKIKHEIIQWFNHAKSPLFDERVVASSPAVTRNALQNFSVVGATQNIMNSHNYADQLYEKISIYCSKVHFELTNYPSEMIYGVHFELNNRQLNEKLCNYLFNKYGFDQQIKTFEIDIEIPKRPEWIFLTRTVKFNGNSEESFYCNLTHARHFVELVGHTYEFLYSKEMIDLYLAGTKPSTSA